ncbi:P68 family surface lipoprotein [Mycoplasma procyoni]|uniref:P68 family surface lipoprotein n=1 Tax=Mycoplasma procyoni TaxID=568784 RepID=UPI00197BB76A|nr:hypothetical protein [Mycoplasma procyoni]MBN3534543.1 hypothetical protein [Mycoplasma procyoni]
MKKITKTLAFGALTLAPLATFLSCQNNTNNENQNPDKQAKIYDTSAAASDNKIIFATGESSVFPMMIAMSQLVPMYNELMKNEEGFIPVELKRREETKQPGPNQLSVAQAKSIETNAPDVANILLGNQSGAFLINTYGKLLDLKDSKIKYNSFSKKIADNHNKLVGEANEKDHLYNLPFNVSDIDAISMNLDLMRLLFDFVKQGGGVVDENSEVYKKAKESENKGSSIPENSLWKALKVKANNSFAGVGVNDATFKTINSAMDFARKLQAGLEIDQTKVKDGMDNIQIFSIDYQQDALMKDLNNRLNGKKMWTQKFVGDKNIQSQISYNIKTDPEIQNKFKEVFNEFSLQTHKTDLVSAGTKKIGLRDIKYEDNKTEWASWDLRTYKTAFAFAAAVGYEQSIKSPTSIGFFAKGKEDVAASFAQADDIWLNPQLFETSNQTYKTFLEGGSSLVPISVDNGGKEDKATIKFLEWLYFGEVTYRGEKIKVSDLIAMLSAYIIPLEQNVTEQKETEIKALLTKWEAKFTAETNQETKNKIQSEINYLKSALVSFGSIKKFVENNDINALHYASDSDTTSLVYIIKDSLSEATVDKDTENSKLSGEEVLKKLIDEINKIEKNR